VYGCEFDTFGVTKKFFNFVLVTKSRSSSSASSVSIREYVVSPAGIAETSPQEAWMPQSGTDTTLTDIIAADDDNVRLTKRTISKSNTEVAEEKLERIPPILSTDFKSTLSSSSDSL